MGNLFLFSSDPFPDHLLRKLEEAALVLPLHHGDAELLREAMRLAYLAIEEACEPYSVGLVELVVQNIERFFSTYSEAKAVAATFPAMVSFRDFIRGPKPAEDLPGLIVQALAAEDLLERLLNGWTIWYWTSTGGPKTWDEGPLQKLY